jgi:hypothetical protein
MEAPGIRSGQPQLLSTGDDGGHTPIVPERCDTDRCSTRSRRGRRFDSGSVTSIALVASGDDLPTGIDTGIRLVTADARAAHAELLALGLSVGELLDWPTAPLMFSFCNLDGNRLYVAEAS